MELLRIALTEREFTFDGEFMKVNRPTTIATRPMQDPLPVWLGGSSLSTMALAARNGWNSMRNFGEAKQHRRTAPAAPNRLRGPGTAGHRNLGYSGSDRREPAANT